MNVYLLTLLFTFLFYFQVGARYRFLMPFRLELIIGTILLLIIILQRIKQEEGLSNDLLCIKLNKAIFFFFIIIIGLIPFAFHITKAIEAFIPFIKVFVTFLIIGYSITTEKQLSGFIWLFSILVVWVGFEGLLNNNYDINGRLLGMRGLWHGANDLGGLLSSGLPFIYAIAISDKNVIKKIAIVSIGVLSVYMIIETLSRTAMLAVIFFAFLIWLRSKKKIVGVAIALIIAIGIWQFSDDAFKTRFKSITNSFDIQAMDGSQEKRLQIFVDGISLFLDRPWGYGIQNFRSARGHTFDRWQDAHCLYTQLLVELGVQGFICFFCIITYILMILNKTLNRLENEYYNNRYLYNITLAIRDYLFIRLFVGILAHNLWTNYWWFAAGLTLAVYNIVFYRDNSIGSSGDRLPILGLLK